MTTKEPSLNIANQAGWDILNAAAFTCLWTGDRDKHGIEIQFDGPVRHELVSSHFGDGVLTFTVGYLFRTPPRHESIHSDPDIYEQYTKWLGSRNQLIDDNRTKLSKESRDRLQLDYL